MSICWFCHWGWPKPIADIYHEALIALKGDDYCLIVGPSHAIWEDENFDIDEARLEKFDEEWARYLPDAAEEEKAIVRKSLEQLLEVDDKYKTEPEGYDDDDERPDKFPPPEGWIMVDGAERRKWQMELQGIVGP